MLQLRFTPTTQLPCERRESLGSKGRRLCKDRRLGETTVEEEEWGEVLEEEGIKEDHSTRSTMHWQLIQTQKKGRERKKESARGEN